MAVLVRAVDIPAWDSLPRRPELRAKLAARPSAGVTAGTCADPSLYRRFQAAGPRHMTMGPRFAIDRPEDELPEWRDYYEGLSADVLSEAEAAESRAAAAHASAEHSFYGLLATTAPSGRRSDHHRGPLTAQSLPPVSHHLNAVTRNSDLSAGSVAEGLPEWHTQRTAPSRSIGLRGTILLPTPPGP